MVPSRRGVGGIDRRVEEAATRRTGASLCGKWCEQNRVLEGRSMRGAPLPPATDGWVGMPQRWEWASGAERRRGEERGGWAPADIGKEAGGRRRVVEAGSGRRKGGKEGRSG